MAKLSVTVATLERSLLHAVPGTAGSVDVEIG